MCVYIYVYIQYVYAIFYNYLFLNQYESIFYFCLFALRSDGSSRPGRESQLRVGRDTELYRILNMHYNKSNIYQVNLNECVSVVILFLKDFFLQKYKY